jgi:hypothetical protein
MAGHAVGVQDARHVLRVGRPVRRDAARADLLERAADGLGAGRLRRLPRDHRLDRQPEVRLLDQFLRLVVVDQPLVADLPVAGDHHGGGLDVDLVEVRDLVRVVLEDGDGERDALHALGDRLDGLAPVGVDHVERDVLLERLRQVAQARLARRGARTFDAREDQDDGLLPLDRGERDGLAREFGQGKVRSGVLVRKRGEGERAESEKSQVSHEGRSSGRVCLFRQIPYPICLARPSANRRTPARRRSSRALSSVLLLPASCCLLLAVKWASPPPPGGGGGRRHGGLLRYGLQWKAHHQRIWASV